MIAPSIAGFGIEIVSAPGAIHIDPRGSFFVRGDLVWTADRFVVSVRAGGHGATWHRQAALDTLQSLTPRDARLLDAFLETLNKKGGWRLQISPARMSLAFTATEPSRHAKEAIARDMIPLACALANETESERLIYSLGHTRSPDARLYDLRELIRVDRHGPAAKAAFERTALHDRSPAIRLEASIALDPEDAFGKLFAKNRSETEIIGALSRLARQPDVVAVWEPLLLKKLDTASARLGAAIANLLAEAGTAHAIVEIEREMREKIFNRGYRRILQKASARLKQRLHGGESGALTVAEDHSGALSK